MDLNKQLTNIQIWKKILGLSSRVRKYLFLYVLSICLNRLSAFAIAYVFSITLLDSKPNAIKYGIMFLMFKLLEWIFFLFQDRFFIKSRSVVIEEVSTKIFEKVMYLDTSKTKGSTSVEMLQKSDIRWHVRTFIGFSINHLGTYIIDVLASCFIIYKIGGSSVDYVLWILLITLVLLLIIGEFVVGRYTRKTSYRSPYDTTSNDKSKNILEEIVDNQNKLIGSTRDLFSKIYVAKIFKAENLFLEVRNKLANYERKVLLDFRHKAVKIYFLVFLLSSISFAILFFLSIEKLNEGILTKESFAAMMLILMSIYWKLQQTTYMFEELITFPYTMSFAFNLLDYKIEDIDRKIKDNKSVSNFLELKNVSFSYGTKKVLDDVSFSLKNDETLFLVGISGAGKSTLFKLLMSEERPDEGSILWKSKPISNYSDVVAWVPQDVNINGGIADFNLSLGKENSTIEEKIESLKRAKLHHRVNESNLHEVLDNKNLSGGEQQRFAISRAFLSNRSLMLLDEPSSALNLSLEKELIEEITKVKDVIKIIIIHRILAIPKGYKVAILQEGKIIEYGYMEELLEKNGVFAKMIEEAKNEQD